MKKGVKVLIAFMVIAALAVGAYFLLKPKETGISVYNNIYEISNNVMKEDVNIVTKVDEAAEDMLSLIITNGFDSAEAQKTLDVFTKLKGAYKGINDEILLNGVFVKTNSTVSAYIDRANSNAKKLKEVYEDSYQYLVGTYFKIVNTDYNIATMKTYIENFNNIFKDILEPYNNFYFNSAYAYAYGLENMMIKNNAYKLKVGYAAIMINEYYNCEDANKEDYLTEANLAISKINFEINNKYFENKDIYDLYANDTTICDVAEIGKNIAIKNETQYIESLANQEQREIAQNYITYVVRG